MTIPLIYFLIFFVLSAHSQAAAYDMGSGVYDYRVDNFDDANTCWPGVASTSSIPVSFEFFIARNGANLSATEVTGSAGAFPIMNGRLSDNTILVGPASKTVNLRPYEESNSSYAGNPGGGNCYLTFDTILSGTLTGNNVFDATLDLKITEEESGGCSEFYDKLKFPQFDGGSCHSIVQGHASLIQSSAPTQDWTLVWSDEFNGSALDKSKWRIEGGASVSDLTAISPDDVWVENGHLRIRTQRRNYLGKRFTSGKVHTLGKFSLLYGRVDIRAKLPSGNGLWAAYWLMPDRGSWPPEIDIIEHYGNKPNTVYMTNHWMTLLKLMLGVDYKWNITYAQGAFTGPDFSQDFHVFSIEWIPGEIRWLVDGVERARSRKGVPDRPMYLIMDTGLGPGEWGKNIDSTTVFPQYHDIDYVRVYMRPGDTGHNI